jgi:hypothetical protein
VYVRVQRRFDGCLDGVKVWAEVGNAMVKVMASDYTLGEVV